MERIKLNFQNSEKILPYIPKSLAQLKHLFHELFPEVDKDYNYRFYVKQNEESIYISEDDCSKKFFNLFEEDEEEKIIYVEIHNEDNINDSYEEDDDILIQQLYDINENLEKEKELNHFLNIKIEEIIDEEEKKQKNYEKRINDIDKEKKRMK